jgi:hypothetical protein
MRGIFSGTALVLTVRDLGPCLKIEPSAVYRLLKHEQLAAFKVGGHSALGGIRAWFALKVQRRRKAPSGHGVGVGASRECSAFFWRNPEARDKGNGNQNCSRPLCL